MRKNEIAGTEMTRITSIPTAENHPDDNPYLAGTEQNEFDEWNRQYAEIQKNQQ